jgi:hypothetical protein
MNSESLYIDLSEDQLVCFTLLADKALPVNEFAQKYATAVQERYQARGLDLDHDGAVRQAAKLHDYLIGL